MAEGHLQLADSYIARAEALNPKYSLFHIGDTPAKCRHDLDKRLGIHSIPGDHAPATAGKLPNDPFLTRNASDSAGATPRPMTPTDRTPADPGLSRLPPIGSSAAAPSRWDATSGTNYPSTGQPPLRLAAGNRASASSARAQSDALLLGARKALAVGDRQRAMSLAEQARRLSANYGPMDDSPARVEALVAKYNDLAAQGNHGDSEGYRHQYAGLLMEEAEGLLRWREYDEAERLTTDAQKINVQYNAIETRPDMLLQRIAAERRSGGHSPADESRLDMVSAGGAGSPLAPLGNTSASPGNKPQAAELTRQARAALVQGNLTRAEQLARQADGLAPDTAFGPQEDRPSIVLLDIQRARLHGGAGLVTAAAEGFVHQSGRHYASRSVYDANNDPTRVIAAAAGEPLVRPLPAAADPNARARRRFPRSTAIRPRRCNCSSRANARSRPAIGMRPSGCSGKPTPIPTSSIRRRVSGCKTTCK